jgi:hypothetical protein
MRLTVTHEGVPIGVVDLDVDDHQGIGTLEPAPAYEAIAPTLWLAAALGARARTELLTLEPDAPPSEPALEKAAALTFELWDERGVYVPTTVVRLVELKTRPGVTAFVEFGRTMSTVPAQPPLRHGGAGAAQRQDGEAS